MWSNAFPRRREDERDRSAPPQQQYHGYQQQPPPQQPYPPPPPEHQQYPEDDSSYPDYGESGALTSTINLVTSAASALFRPPPPVVQPAQMQHQPPSPPSIFPPLRPDSSMLSNHEPQSHQPPHARTFPQPAGEQMYPQPPGVVPQGYAPRETSPSLNAAVTYGPPPVAAASLMPSSALQPSFPSNVAATYAPPPSFLPPPLQPSTLSEPPSHAETFQPAPQTYPQPAVQTFQQQRAAAVPQSYAPRAPSPMPSPTLQPAATTYVPPPVIAASPMPSPALQSSFPSNVTATCVAAAAASPVVPLSQPSPRTFLPPSTPLSSPRSTTSSKFTASPRSTSSSIKFKLPPLALPRPVVHPSPRAKKWGGFKVPPPIPKGKVRSEIKPKREPSSPSEKSVSSVPGGITFQSAASAPSPMASPRMAVDAQMEDTTGPPPPFLTQNVPPHSFAPAPPVNVTPQVHAPPQVEEWVPRANVQAEESVPPQFFPPPTAPPQMDESPPPPFVAPPPAHVSRQINEPAPTAPQMDESPPPPFISAPLAYLSPQMDESAPTPFVASAYVSPQQTEGTTRPPPPPSAFVAPPRVDETSTYVPPPLVDDTAPPAAVSTFAPQEPVGPPVNVPSFEEPASISTFASPPVEMPSFEGVSPENEVPESDHHSTVGQMEPSPEQTATQEHVEEEPFLEPPPEVQRSPSFLPDGWTEVLDPASGQTYYYNEESGVSSWERPVAEEFLSNEDALSYGQEEEAQMELPPEQTLSQQVEEDDQAGDVVIDSSSEEEESQSQPALPFGWTEQVDPSTGMSYFCHVESGVTTWERPNEEETKNEEEAQVADDDSISAALGALPDGWTKEIDEVSGRIYYYHAESGKTSWDWPSALEVANSIAGEYAMSEQVHAPCAEEADELEFRGEMEKSNPEIEPRIGYPEDTEICAPLPAGWSEHIDPASGRPYYVNSTENVTSWERPPMPNSYLTVGDTGLDEGHTAEAAPDGAIDSASTQVDEGQHVIDLLPESTAFVVAAEDHMSTEMMDSEASETSRSSQTDSDSESSAAGSYASQSVEIPFTRSEEGGEENPEGSLPVETEPYSEEAETPNAELPENWEELVDPVSGLLYYYNVVEGTTTWDRPVATQDSNENTAHIVEDVSDQKQAHQVFEDEPRLSESELSTADTDNPPVSASLPAEAADDDWNLVSLLDTPEAVTDQLCSDGNPEVQVESAATMTEDNEEISERQLDGVQLPPDWIELIDPASGNPYYLNEVTNVSTWERPVFDEATLDQQPAGALAEIEQPMSEVNQVGTTDNPETEVNMSLETFASETEISDGSTDHIPASVENEHIEESVVQELSQEPDQTDTLTLPPGWIELFDPTSGRPYYLNEVDNTTSWEKPVVDRPEPDIQVRPEASNVRGKNKNETVEESVGGVVQSISSFVEQEAEVVHGRDKVEDTTDEVQSLLPVGWVEMIDLASGDPYYFNEAENLTTWERPELIPEEQANTDKVLPSPPDETSAPESRRKDDIVDDYAMVEHSETEPGAEPPADSSISELPDDGQAELPTGWVKQIDDASGTAYYLNEAENMTTWERPSNVSSKGGLSGNDADVGKPDEDRVIEEKKTSPSDREMKNRIEDSSLPRGWAELVDPETGKTYYFHEASNVTTWDRPSDPVTSDKIDRNSFLAGTAERNPARVFATFGFGGKLCVWKSHAPSTVAVYRIGDLMQTDPVVLAEQKKKESNILGPLNACEEAAVLNHIESKATNDTRNEAPSHDLLWSLVLIAAKSNGRLRSDDGVRNPRSAEAGVISLLLDETNGETFANQPGIPRDHKSQDEEVKGEVAALSSLKTVENLLLWGRREEAVQEAIRSKNFAMALLVASMCDRATFQEATKQFADDILSPGSPLHTLAMLFSGQLQPPADGSLDKNGAKSSIWDDSSQHLHLTWRQHLAATISNRTLGWDRIVLSLGDQLLDSGSTQAAHFCFMVCGCPVTSLLHPLSRMSLVGCDHLVPMDAALMTSEGVSSYERTEAYEWAKRRGNPNAAIPSLQPFKLMYAMLLADMGFEKHAQMYVRSIRQCCGLEETKKSKIPDSISSTVWTLSVRDNFEDALDEFEDRLSQGKLRRVEATSLFGSESSTLMGNAGAASSAARKSAAAEPAVAVGKQPLMKVKVKRPRAKKASPQRTSEMGPVTKEVTFMKPEEPCEDINATFLSAQSNLLDVTASSIGERSTEPTKREERRRSLVGTAGREATERKIDSSALEKPKVEVATLAPPGKPLMAKESSPSRKTDIGKKELKVKPPPNSAPAMLGSTKTKSVGASPQRAPSSDKKGSKWGLGIKDKMTKWLNPDATTADLGEGMQAYYDEKRKVWVFPGEDPDEKAKPIGPPPTVPTASEKTEESPKAPKDPLAAMMAPPQRASSFHRSSSLLSQTERGSLASRYPGMLPLGAAKPPGSLSSLSAGGPPPQFTVFKPAPVAKEEKESTN